MPYLLIIIAFVSTIILTYLTKGIICNKKNLPLGSLGFPIIGETLSFGKAHGEDKGLEWLNQRVSKYGPIFKTSIIGCPTIIIVGQAGNKFVLGTSDDVIAAKKPLPVRKIMGNFSFFELTGSRHKLVKGAMASLLKPESLHKYIGRIEELVKRLIVAETMGRDNIKAVPLMKKITLYLSCSILFGIDDDHIKAAIFEDMSISLKAMTHFPVNFPGTPFRRGIEARKRIADRLLLIMEEKKVQLSNGVSTPTSDVFSSLLSVRDENQQPLHDDEVIDNLFTLLFASHDTSAVVLSLMTWKLATDSQVYHKILEEHLDILRQRKENDGKRLTWEEIQKMKYTWQVLQELMRLVPPIFGIFRKVLEDTSFGGYDIPKGWQVLVVTEATHIDGNLFENPETFDPRRFDKNVSKPIAPYTYIPFGGGHRACIGNEFARVGILTTIHNLVTKYEWSQINPEEVITRKPMPYPSMGLPIKIKPRNAS